MQNLHTMKKFLVLSVLSLGMTMLVSTTGHAFTGLNRSTSTAIAQLTATGSVAFNISIRKISDNTVDPAGNLNWTVASLPASWVRSNNYILMNSTVTTSGGGIQIYTDNMNAVDANPLFSGTPATTDPSGLVDASAHQLRLPMAWSIKADGSTPVAAEPNNNATDVNAPQWVYFKDKATVDIASQGTVHFTNGEQAVTVLDGSLGIHGTQTQFFPGSFPNTRIYPEVNFGLAVTPRTYQTSTLRLEAYTQ